MEWLSVLHVSEAAGSLDFSTIHQFHELAEQAEDVRVVLFEHFCGTSKSDNCQETGRRNFGTQFIYDTAHLMYNPTELEEALS